MKFPPRYKHSKLQKINEKKKLDKYLIVFIKMNT